MYIEDPIGEALGLSPLSHPLPNPDIIRFNQAPAWNKGIPGTTTLGMKFGPMSEERKNKISNSKKGSIPWNKGIPGTGKKPGFVCTQETKLKISETKKNKPRSEKCIAADAQRSKSLKGRIFSEEHREKLRQAAIARYSNDNK